MKVLAGTIFAVGILLPMTLERQTGAKVYTNGAESRNVAQNGGYAARYKATAGFQKIPENQVLLNEGKVEQNEGYTDASAEYNGWQE